MSRILDLYSQLTLFYKENAPSIFDEDYIFPPATEEDLKAIETILVEKIPQDYREFLQINTIPFSFDGSFTCLSAKAVLGYYKSMTEMLQEGVFDDGRVQYHKENGFGNWEKGYIQEVWWSEKWLPISADSCGNLKCIDFAPTKKGKKYQILSMEVQDGQGPFISNYKNFEEYLSEHLFLLQNNKYMFEEDWKGRQMISPNRYKS